MHFPLNFSPLGGGHGSRCGRGTYVHVLGRHGRYPSPGRREGRRGVRGAVGHGRSRQARLAQALGAG